MEKLDRLTREMASEYIGCSLSVFDRLVKEGYLNGTFLELFGRRFFFTSRLDEWMLKGGTLNKEGVKYGKAE